MKISINCTGSEYAQFAHDCNEQGLIIQLQSGFYVGVKYEQTLEELKTQKLRQITTWTSLAITGGFISTCTSSEVRYDSDVDTQITMQGIALNVNTEQFVREYPQGCPVRGYAENATEKQIFLLQAAQVLQFCADLSKHIGAQKQRGWELQEVVKVAETKEELAQIIW